VDTGRFRNSIWQFNGGLSQCSKVLRRRRKIHSPCTKSRIEGRLSRAGLNHLNASAASFFCRLMQRPSVKRQRPTMRFVPVKTEEQQANGIVFRARDLLVRQRTQCVNALRGHLMVPKGITHVETLVAVVEDLQSSLPDSVRVILSRPSRNQIGDFEHAPPSAIRAIFG
jgi:hypothetical protein